LVKQISYNIPIGIENYATSDESEPENYNPLPTKGKQKPSKPSMETVGALETSRPETELNPSRSKPEIKSSRSEKDKEDGRNKTEDCQTELKKWISRLVRVRGC